MAIDRVCVCQPSSPSLISCHSSDERDTRGVVFEDRKCPLALETLLSHTERDKSGGNANGSDHGALQRRARELLMPDSESVTSSHKRIWEQFFLFWHTKGKKMRSIFFSIYNCQLDATSTSRPEIPQKEEQLRSSAKRKSPELKRVKVQSANESYEHLHGK